MIKDSGKTKEQLIDELTASRQQVSALEALVSEREQVEVGLKQEMQRVQHYLDVAGVMFVVIDKDQRVTLINQKGCEILGYRAEEIINKNWFDTFLPEAIRAEVKKVFTQLVAGEIAPAKFFENPILTKNGQERMIAWHNAIIKGEQGEMIASLSSGRNITEHKRAQASLQKHQDHLELLVTKRTAKLKAINERLQAEIAEREQAEQALRESQIRFAGILDIAKEAIISVDETGQIILSNMGAEEIFTYPAAEVIGQPLDILLPKKFVTIYKERIASFARSATTTRLVGERQEIVGLRKDGEEFPAEVSISKFEMEDERIFTIVLRDITARKRVETEREKLIAELRALSQAAQAITSELSLEQVLQTIVEAARVLVKVKYAALGVRDEQGGLSRFVISGIDPADQAKIGPWPIGRGLLGLIFQQGESLIIEDIARHPAAVGFPEHHPDMHSLLGVPIFSKGKLIGALYLSDKEDQTKLIETDQELVEMLTLHAAIAIENAHLYEQTQRLATLEERKRFAQDLHDSIIQSLYAVGLALDQVKLDIVPTNQAAGNHIDLCLKSLASVIQDLRSYIFDLRPQAMQQRGLKVRLSGLLEELRVNIRLPVKAEIYPDIDACLSEPQASHIFHICHEALSNAARHAKANQILVRLTREEDIITLLVEDDGLGFEVPPQINPGHRGLANIQGRASLLGATLEIDTKPYRGTRLTVTWMRRSGI